MNAAVDTYPSALKWMLSLPDWERGRGTPPIRESILLERPRALLNALGDPQNAYCSILIAGTKGKGSTAALLESILRAAGYRTGLYTSPHLHTYRERIRVNGEMVSETAFARGAGDIQKQFDALLSQHPDFESFSTFEVMTALSLKQFQDAQVEVAILEVGIGGRLDATNVVDGDLSLITPISYDHMAVLGDTLPKIATEKAGIIKQGKIALSAPQHPEALAVIERVALEQDAVLGVGERDWLWLGTHTDFMVAAEPHAGLWNTFWHDHDLQLPFLGTHQFVNAALAVAAAHVIDANWEKRIGGDAIARGIARTQWAGRLEILQPQSDSQSLILADGAHNGDSAEKLFEAVRFHFQFERLFLIFGVLGDKEIDAIARPFVIPTEFAWTVKTDHPRSRSAEEVAMSLNNLGMRARPVATIEEALKRARERATPRDLILITGSLSIVAQAREAMGFAHEKDPQIE